MTFKELGEWIVVAATVGVLILLGVFGPGLAFGQDASITDGPWVRDQGIEWRLEHPEMDGNVTITLEEQVPLSQLRHRYLSSGGHIGEGQIVLGLAQITKYRLHVPGRFDYKCHISMYGTARSNPQTYEHELKHCAGWVHQ